jgi:hypothetical protein
MVRRATLDLGENLHTDDEDLPGGQPQAPQPSPKAGFATTEHRNGLGPEVGLHEALGPEAGPRNALHWRGGGGRWLVWLGRAVVWAVIIVVGYRGVVAIFDGSRPNEPAAATASTHGSAFPETLAEAFALQFGSVYLNFSPATAAIRSHELSRFLPPGPATQMGWNGAGTQRLVAEQVSSVSVTSSHQAIVTLLARLGSGRLIELAVPVYAAGGGMSVSGDPALLPAPARATPPQAGTVSPDLVAQGQLQSQLPAFFQAYASGDRTTLARFEWGGARINGLNGTVTFGGIDSLFAPPGGARRLITVTVSWNLASSAAASGAIASAPASLQMTYQMTVVRQRGSWDVLAIGASTQSPGPP